MDLVWTIWSCLNLYFSLYLLYYLVLFFYFWEINPCNVTLLLHRTVVVHIIQCDYCRAGTTAFRGEIRPDWLTYVRTIDLRTIDWPTYDRLTYVRTIDWPMCDRLTYVLLTYVRPTYVRPMYIIMTSFVLQVTH